MTYRDSDLTPPLPPSLWERFKRTNLYSILDDWAGVIFGVLVIVAIAGSVGVHVHYLESQENKVIASCERHAGTNAREWGQRMFPGKVVHIEPSYTKWHDTFDVVVDGTANPINLSCGCYPHQTCSVQHHTDNNN